MNLTKLFRIAADAQILLWGQYAQRVGVRIALGVICIIFVLFGLAGAQIAAWTALQPSLTPLMAALAVLGFDAVLAPIFAWLALRSSPGRIEREAMAVRDEAKAQLALTADTASPISPSRLLASRPISTTLVGGLTVQALRRR